MHAVPEKQCSEVEPEGSLPRRSNAGHERSPSSVNNQPRHAALRLLPRRLIPMLIENELVVELPPEKTFETLFDVQLVASCVPGAELVESVSPTEHRGRVAVRLGPVSMRFCGIVSIVEQDRSALTGRIQAKGSDEKGRGSAQSTTEFKIEPVAGGSRVLTKTELSLSGLAAQYGRASGVVRVLANELVAAFASNLRARLDTPGAVAHDSEGGSVQPDHGAAPPALSLFGFLWSAMKRRMRRADVSVAKQSR